jgi:hypothetical protein
LRKKLRGVFASVKPFIIPSEKVKILQIANFFGPKLQTRGRFLRIEHSDGNLKKYAKKKNYLNEASQIKKIGQKYNFAYSGE